MKSLRNTVFVLLLTAFFLPEAFAGPALKRAEFEFHIGPAFPVGSFAKKAFSAYSGTAPNFRLDYNGAQIGLNYGLAFQYYATPHFGMLVMFNGHSNKISANNFSTYNPSFAWKTNSQGKWSEFMAMAGITCRITLPKLHLAFRAYLGYAHLVAPYYGSQAKHQNYTYTYQLKSASDANFGYGAGMALKFLVTRGFHLDLRCDYMSAVPFYFRRVKSTVITEIPNVTIPDQVFRNTFREHFQMVNLSFGFTVAF
ncbi:MAG: hypothetical protein J1F29_01780 [Lentimicrobiaceae bacterium]|nr:hypothetical protein [Lentimicrobiaceae bacterium]